jgi:hypothetical protein
MTEEITELFTEILISKIENRIADRLASHFQAENQEYQFEDVEIDRVERDFDRRRARRNAAANSNKLTFKHFAIGAGIVGVILKHLHNQRKNNQMLAAIHAKQQSKKQKGSSNGAPRTTIIRSKPLLLPQPPRISAVKVSPLCSKHPATISAKSVAKTSGKHPSHRKVRVRKSTGKGAAQC